jgi:catechol 2,3-dioxygenase-like lactoylglutathione lyase family enzyme
MRLGVSIDVPSIEEGIAFYGRAFGFKETSRPIEGVANIRAGDAQICLLAKAAGSSPAPGTADVRRYERHWTPVHIDVHVEDFDAALERAKEAGARCEQLHRLAGYPPVAFCCDPFGHGFCIIGKRV